MKSPRAFSVNLETDAFSLEQTTSLDFDPLYEVASNPVVWEQHPEKAAGLSQSDSRSDLTVST